jgi:dihydrofolate reductase
MRKIFLHINVSVDGYIEDEKREMDWRFADDEWEVYINGVLRSIDGMIFGRVTHQLLAQYWPTAGDEPNVSARHIEAARLMNAQPKYAVSRGNYVTNWTNSQVISGDVASEIQKLKNQPEKILALFAGTNIAQSFMGIGLLDEYRLVLNPALLGGGTPLFKPGRERVGLTLLSTRKFASGAVLLVYAPMK